MKLLSIAFLFLIVGCNDKAKVIPKIITNEHALGHGIPFYNHEFKGMGDTTSKGYRYFKINYEVVTADCSQTHSGEFWFVYPCFPSINYLDSSIYSVLPMKKNCYQPVIITNIFEFKNGSDFHSFSDGYAGTWKAKKHKQDCSKDNWADTLDTIKYGHTASH